MKFGINTCLTDNRMTPTSCNDCGNIPMHVGMHFHENRVRVRVTVRVRVSRVRVRVRVRVRLGLGLCFLHQGHRCQILQLHTLGINAER